MAAAKTDRERVGLTIKPPNLQMIEFAVTGTAPYVQARFSKKEQLITNMEAGSTSQSKSRKARPPRDFEYDYQQSMHFSTEGWNGIPAPAFRNALISACRVAGFVMTRAKLSVFIVPDGFSKDDGTPLIKITKGKPRLHTAVVRNNDGSPDVRARAMFLDWGCVVRVRYDGDQFTATDVCNLMERAGLQVGIGEGRPDAPRGVGMGWGTFTTGEESNGNKRKKRT